ncbi:MAG: glycosyltransferase [Planctomycetota bacterium]
MKTTVESAPIPIAFCITELDRGGAERALSQLVLGLNRDEWLPRVYCLGPRGHFADVIEAGGVAVECFGGTGVMSLPRVLLQLTMALRRFRPAVLQTFLFHANIVGRFAGRLARVPRIVSGIRVADHRSRWYGRIDRWTNGLVDHNVCVSQGVAEFSIKETGLSHSNLSVIPNGVDCELFASATPADLTQFGIPQGSPIVITVGRLEEQKGIDLLLTAASLVLHDHRDCHFLIVGDGCDRAALESQAKQLGITNSVHFIGQRADVPSLIAASTAFVLPSRWEGMSNALLEAMAAGLPVVATAVEGSTELVRSGETGVLVPVGTSEGLATAIRSILEDSDHAREMAAAAQTLVKQGYTAESTASAHSELYRQLARRD